MACDCRDVSAWLSGLGPLGRRWRIQRYLNSHDVHKLDIGSGPSMAAGWLRTDIRPGPGSIYMNATKRFPFGDATFDYVYSEHMIEHVPWGGAVAMLEECHRVLKPGGALRIATPDLEVLLGVYVEPDEPANREYRECIARDFLPAPQMTGECELDSHPARILANAYGNWGHQVLWDADLLERALEACGFTSISRHECGESDCEEFRGLESHGDNIGNASLALFETLVLEARKPD